IYTVVVTNTGPANATGVGVSDVVPNAILNIGANCAASSGSSCAASINGNAVFATANITVGNSITLTLTGNINGNALSALTNIASITVPASISNTNPITTATDATTLTSLAFLGISKTDNQTTAIPGTPITYTVIVTNAGPSNVTNATLNDVASSLI